VYPASGYLKIFQFLFYCMVYLITISYTYPGIIF
jgi:hypothetical protein